MTAGEKARLDLAASRVGVIIGKLSPTGDSPFLEDMKALQDELYAIPEKPFLEDMKALQDELYAIPEKPDPDVRKLGEQLGSAVSGLVGENATVNVYVTVNGK